MMIDVTKLNEEVNRLKQMGVLDVTFRSLFGRKKTAKFICIDYGVTNHERDFILFRGPYGMNNRDIHRAIDVQDIIDVKRSEVQSFDRHTNKRESKANDFRPPVIPHNWSGRR